MDKKEKITERYAFRAVTIPLAVTGDNCFDPDHRREKKLMFNKILNPCIGNDFQELKHPEREAGTEKNRSKVHKDQGDASNLYVNVLYDAVLQSIVFISIPYNALKKKPDTAMLRMVKQEGIKRCCDFHFDNPRSKHVITVGERGISQFLPGAPLFNFFRVVLARPFKRGVYGLYNLINFVFPFLRTHIIPEISI